MEELNNLIDEQIKEGEKMIREQYGENVNEEILEISKKKTKIFIEGIFDAINEMIEFIDKNQFDLEIGDKVHINSINEDGIILDIRRNDINEDDLELYYYIKLENTRYTHIARRKEITKC